VARYSLFSSEPFLAATDLLCQPTERVKLGGGLGALSGRHLLAVLVVSNTRRGGAIATTFCRSDTNDLAMDGARNAVLQLEVHLGNCVLGKDRGVRNVTDSGRLDHVADGEPLDRLVLGRAS